MSFKREREFLGLQKVSRKVSPVEFQVNRCQQFLGTAHETYGSLMCFGLA